MILIIDLNKEKDSLGVYEFINPIKEVLNSIECEVKHYKEINSKDLNEFEKIIISGTPMKDNDFRNNLEAFSWLKKTDKPILGICAGMQAIALTYGCELEKCKEIGMTKIKTVSENYLFEGEFEAYELHSSSIKPNNSFEVLAVSENCVQAIKYKGKDVYGVTFHPEVRNQEILRKFIEITG